MDGDLGPLPDLCALAEEFGCIMMVDDAHASGVFGRNGRGTIDHFDMHGRVDVQVGTLSKAIGALGGYVAGSRTLIDFLCHRARPFLFSTSHPPAVAAACIAALDVLLEEPQIIDRLWENTRFFKAGLAALGFDTGPSESPITPVIVGDAALAMTLSDRLFERGVFAQGIGFPTVARGRARVRTIVTATHTREQLQFALDAFAVVGHELGIVPAQPFASMNAKALLMTAIVVSLVDGGAGPRGAPVKAAESQQTPLRGTSRWKRASCCSASSASCNRPMSRRTTRCSARQRTRAAWPLSEGRIEDRGASRVVIQERERLRVNRAGVDRPLFRLVVDVFAESVRKPGSRPGNSRPNAASDGRWRITRQERLSSVENLYRLSLNRTKQFDARNFTVKAEDLELTLVEGTVFTIDTDAGTTGLVLMGHGEMRFHPTPDTEQGQVRIFSGESAIEGRFDAAYLRMGAVEPHASLSQLVERPVDPRDLRRAEQIFREESSKSFVIDLGDLSRDPWSLLPSGGDFLAEYAPGATTRSPTPDRSQSPRHFLLRSTAAAQHLRVRVGRETADARPVL